MRPNRITLTIAAVIITLAAGLIQAVRAGAQEAPEGGALGLARISYMTGDVLLNTKEDDEWADAAPNYPLIDGDRLWVGDDSKLELRFDTGETAWVNYQSELDMLTLSRGDNGNAYQMALPFGEASFNVNNFEILGSVFQVDTPNTSIRAYGRAAFRVTSLSDGTTQVGVADGSVEVETDRGIANIHDGEMLEVTSDGRSRITDLPAPDDWDDWVASRLDRYQRQYRSDRYLPSQMDEYASEFEDNGRWVSYPSYGNVWVPNVAAGWSPYSNGRWIWSGWDYVWLPYDPWYAPFHYGRWTWTSRFGWCWIPPLPTNVFWSPGYVGWVWDTDYVYWVPLAPGEVYYGYGYYGPHSVNIYKTTVIVNKNVYKNCDFRNGVVVVRRDNFLKGRTDRVREEKIVRKFKEKIVRKEIVKEKIVKEEVAFGAPPAKAIKPVRDSWLPKPEKVYKADRLPKKVIERERFEKERSVVRGKVKSAFKPAQEPRHMEKLERFQKPEFKREERKLKKEEKAITRERTKEETTGGTETRKERKELKKEDKTREKSFNREMGVQPERGGGSVNAPGMMEMQPERRGGGREMGVQPEQGGGGNPPGMMETQPERGSRGMRSRGDTGQGGAVYSPEGRGGKAPREEKVKTKDIKEKKVKEKRTKEKDFGGDEGGPGR